MKETLKKIDKIFFSDFYTNNDEYKNLLKKELSGMDSLLDVGCGYISPAYEFFKDMKYTVGVDGYANAIKIANERKVHTEQFVFDVRKLSKKFKPKSFDCVIALDLIEHLTPDEGLKLLKDMEEIAIKKVIVFTPNGFIEQSPYDNNILQIHKSGWTPKQFRKLGYSVRGINGLKYLRTQEAHLKYNPEIVWQRISYITQNVTRKIPSLSYQMFCVKNLK